VELGWGGGGDKANSMLIGHNSDKISREKSCRDGDISRSPWQQVGAAITAQDRQTHPAAPII
jgi:hypothetical protein